MPAGVVVVVATVLGLTGCDSEPSPTAASSPAAIVPAPPPAPQNPDEAYESALSVARESVRVNLDAYRAGNGDTSRLQDVATGEALTNQIAAVEHHAEQGYVVSGDITVEPLSHEVRTLETDGRDALRDIPYGDVLMTLCLDYSRFVLTGPDGSPGQRSGPARGVIEQHVVWLQADHAWKVRTAAATGGEC
jgi:hypothetical protein